MDINSHTYYLMHKNIKILLLDIDYDGRFKIINRNALAMDHLPLGGQMNDMKLHEWWNDRSIPETRHNVKNALQKIGMNSTSSLLVNNLALSLNDCYWICPQDKDLKWEDVNLFNNDFVDEFGEITINESKTIDLKNKTKFYSATSQGELQKKWCIDSLGKRFLVKGNYGESFAQSINEIFASNLHSSLGYKNYTDYKLCDITLSNNTKGIGCMSYNFCDEHTESISAWELLQTIKIKKNESLYYPLKDVCIRLGMKEEEFTNYMDYEILTDYLITNTDRHMNNIAILRDPDSLKIKGFAPIYDSGNSMFYNIPLEQLSKIDLSKIETHSFIKKEVELLKYVQNRNIINLDLIKPNFDIYLKDIDERHNRIPELEKLFNQKITLLKQFQKGKNIWQ